MSSAKQKEPVLGQGCEDLSPEWEFGALQCPVRENCGCDSGRAQGTHLGWSKGSIWAWGKGQTSGRAGLGGAEGQEQQKSQGKLKPSCEMQGRDLCSALCSKGK